MVGSIPAATLVHNSSPQCPIDWAKQNRHIPGTAEAAAAAKKFPRWMFFGAASAKKAIQMAVARGTPVKKRTVRCGGWCGTLGSSWDAGPTALCVVRSP
jgi:hypothetical protein